MKIPKSDLIYQYMRGKGPGGQHRNKTDSACRVRHLPTGLMAFADERSQHHSKRKATRILIQRIRENASEQSAADKKAERDRRIQPSASVRTYDFKSGVVTDHRTGKKASVKDVLRKGKLGLLR